MAKKQQDNSPELQVASGDGEPVQPGKDRKFVEALSRGLDVLRAFSQGSVILGNQDIARITGLPKPTVSRMTYTLTKLGYLGYNQQLEKYQLSSGVLALGYAYVSNLKVRQLAKPYMDEFARQTNMSVGLTCRDRLHMIYVENRLPPEATLLRMDIGLKLPINFDRPYLSTGIQEFWRRWHITLGRFFRDYLYIPLGGNRSGYWRTCINVMTVFILGGFWHGAALTFILWGCLIGLGIVFQGYIQSFNVRINRWTAWISTLLFMNIVYHNNGSNNET